MEEYTSVLKEYLQGKRNYTKTMFKIMGTLYRAVSKERITWEEGLKKLNNL